MTAPVYPGRTAPAVSNIDPRVAAGVREVLLQLGAEHAIHAVLKVVGTAPAAGAAVIALSEREAQVLRGMSRGQSNIEIGRRLFVSTDTVKTHARRLFRKLGARDRAHAVARGYETGLLGGAS